jgi:cytoskeletal protein RodZ
MSDLGALLRKAREQRGYTLDDIQEATKIRKRYLEAIENGDYKVLPGSFYVRAFVKNYAEMVGLDAEEVLRLYQKELPKVNTDDAMPSEPLIRKRRRSLQHKDRWGKVTVTLLMWLFPILIIVIVYIYLQENWVKNPEEVKRSPLTTETSTPSASISSPVSNSPVVTPSLPASPSTEPVSLRLVQTKQSVQYYEVSPGGPHKLELEVTGKVWIGINEKNSSGKSIFTGSFEDKDAPQTLSFDLNGPLYVNVGRADNVTIRIGGTLVDDGNRAGSSKFVFTPVDAP